MLTPRTKPKMFHLKSFTLIRKKANIGLEMTLSTRKANEKVIRKKAKEEAEAGVLAIGNTQNTVIKSMTNMGEGKIIKRTKSINF